MNGYKGFYLDGAAELRQLGHSIRSIATVDNLAIKPTAMSIRRSVAQDIAHLPLSAKYTSTNLVRQSLMHTRSSMNQGVTADFIGEVDVEYYNFRADNQYVHSRQPKFTSEPLSSVRNARISYAEMEQYRIENGLDIDMTNENKGNVLSRRMKAERLERARAEATIDHIDSRSNLAFEEPASESPTATGGLGCRECSGRERSGLGCRERSDAAVFAVPAQGRAPSGSPSSSGPRK